MEIGVKIRELRLKNQLTQEELADLCDLTKGYISQLENDANSPSITTLKDILDCLGCSRTDFSPTKPKRLFSPKRIRSKKKLTGALSVGLFLRV